MLLYVAMYIQEIKTKKKNKTGYYKSTLIKESFRTKDGPRSRTICNISKLTDKTIQVIKNTLQGTPIVNMDEIELESAVDYGGIAVLKELWEEVNLSKVLDQCGDIAMIKAMIFSRILFPGSKLMLEMLSEGTALAPSLGLKNEELSSDAQYEAMDKLTGNWANIEKKLYQDRHNQGLEVAQIVLYDITSIYFGVRS